jgi:glycosyltransferase involved in cell wall biosynthesis
LLDEIARQCPGDSTLVIDDGSSDGTYQVARGRSPTVRMLRNLGIGGAIQTGIKYAERNDFDFCVQIDGDGQHPPSEIAKLVQAYRDQPRSIIIGSRYLSDGGFNSTLPRRAGSAAIAGALGILFPQCQVSDPTSGMRLLDRAAIRLFSARYPHDYPEPISLAWALREGLSVGEVPVTMRARVHGQSSIIGWKPLAYMFRVLSYILLARFMRFYP